MRKVVLHIGRHKTGTTAIQRFLSNNRKLLREKGFSYPEFGQRSFGHHDIGAPLTRASLAEPGKNSSHVIGELRQGLCADVSDNELVVVISSESFQNCDPAVVRQLFSDCDVQVIVYLREQVGYLLSAYAQKVQATNYSASLREFYHQTNHATYKDFLDAWAKAFNDQIHVKVYDRSELSFANVVVDFCESVLGLNANSVFSKSSESDANPSLTSDLIEFKLMVNRSLTLTEKEARSLFRALSRLTINDCSGPITLSREFAIEATERYRDSNAYVAQKYFNRTVLFHPFDKACDEGEKPVPVERMRRVRDQLIADTPELESCLMKLAT